MHARLVGLVAVGTHRGPVRRGPRRLAVRRRRVEQREAHQRLDDLPAEQARAADMKNFEAGYSGVERHGDLTATGAAVMAAARDYMDKAARSTQPQ